MKETKTNQNNIEPIKSKPFLHRFKKCSLPDLKANIIFWSTLVIGLLLDLWTKKAVFEWLLQKPGNNFPIIKDLIQFVMVVNDGAAFGMLSGQRYSLIITSIIALTVILAIFLSSRNWSKLFYIGLGMLASGVCGNLYDRLFNDGLVRDFIFIDVVYWPGKHWPAFNVGDSFMCIGMGLLIISTFIAGRSGRKHGQQRK